MAAHGVIVMCGLIATYNGEPYAYKNIGQVLRNKLRMEGFIIRCVVLLTFGKALTANSDHPEYNKEFYETFIPMVRNGDLKIKEDVTNGIESAEKAFIGLLIGKNEGKAVVKLAD